MKPQSPPASATDAEIARLLDSLEQQTCSAGLSPDLVRQLRLAYRSHVQQLRETMFNGLLDAAPDAMVTVDESGDIVLFNGQAEKMFGYRREEVIGQKIELLVPESVRAAHSEHRQRYAIAPDARPTELRGEFTARRKDGSEFHVEISLSPVRMEDGVLVATAIRDITRRKQTEEAIRQSEERFRLLVEGAKDYALFLLDPEGNIVSWNSGAERIKGYKAHEIIGRSFCGCYTPEDVKGGRPQRALEIAAREGRYEQECWIVRKDGSRFWSSTLITALRNEDGSLRGFAELARDTTEQKLAENALRESDATLHSLIDANIIGIIQGEEDRITEANDVFLKMLGYTREEAAAGKLRWTELTPPEYAALDQRAMEELTATGASMPFEKEYLRKDGSRVPVLIGTARLSENPQRWICYVNDLSEQKRALAERLKLVTIVENSPDFIGIATLEGESLFLNAGGRRLIGLGPDAPLPHVMEYFVPQDRAFHEQEVFPTVLREGRWAGEFAFRHFQTQEPISVLGDVFTVNDPKTGRPAYVATVIRDIRDRKRIELEREQLLEQARVAKEQAERANQAKDNFLAVLSHELRTPLAPVLATIALINGKSDLPSDVRDEVYVIQRNVELEARLIDDLLDLTRISRGKIELHHEVLDLHTAIQQTLEICQADVQAKKLEVSMSLWAERHRVWADPGRLQQVLWNLLKNAIKFTPDHGRIGLRTSDADGRLRVEISDSGVGIEPDLLPRLFNAFEQGGKDTTRQFGGLGLGLAISKAIVDLHGGVITASSEGRGKGATFTVELATTDAVASTAPSPPASAKPKGRKVSILFVEDNDDTRRVMAQLLRASGYSVKTAGSVREASDLLTRERVDLLISDLGLPDGTGYDIMRHVRQRTGIKGIALSGYGMEEDIARSLESGFSRHLTKPVKPQELNAVISALVSP